MRKLTTSTETPRQRAWARSLRELSWRGWAHPRTRCGLRPALARGITTGSLAPRALAGANDLPNGSSEYAYDANGNMASDSGRGITSVAYDRLNLPRRVACKDGTIVAFKYDALGRKLAETDSVPLASIVRPLALEPFPGGVVDPSFSRYNVTTTEYSGNCVYRGGALQRVLIPGGYATPKTGGFDYHYYVCDYLGSVRAVVAEDGTVEEANDYYPYGMQVPDSNGEVQRKQPYKFGGKEHLTAGGLNIHDFGPRALYAPSAQFASPDPKCEDYTHLSPYLYCAANPVNAVDPTGCRPIYSITGEFLGVTDDNGLQGDYIVMNEEDFKTGMTLDEANAKRVSPTSMTDDAYEKLSKHYENLPNRPDYDGYLTLDEANDWYRNGNGEKLYVDLENIDLSGLVSLGEKFVGQERHINLLIAGHLQIPV